MLTYPTIDPIAFSIGPLAVHWYGLMYLFGFAAAWLIALYQIRFWPNPWTKEQVNDLVIYSAFGVMIGGRVGYMLFYNTYTLFHQPWELFAIWHGGMSFHGGFLGVVIAAWLYCRRYHKSFVTVADFCAPLAPLGLGFGRIGNFINGELWGRATDVPWAMQFPQADELLRHPSQLYECALEGFILFLMVHFYSRLRPPPFAIASFFLLFYGIFRFILEFFREPDSQLGFILFDHFSMGQLLSLPMIMIGIIGLITTYYRAARKRIVSCNNI